jgi:uracil-DNA glycosylase family 4
MKAFFSKNEVVGQTDNCFKCGLHKTCKSPRMGYTGKGRLGVLIIAEAPGKTEDDQNTQLVGQAGGLLRGVLDRLGFDLDRDFWKINAVNCRPTDKQGNNRKPTAIEIRLCYPRVIETIKRLKPKFIWLMGGVALDSIYMSDFSDTSITRWRKRCIPDRDLNTWVVPLYHPSFVVRNKDVKLSNLFEKDIAWATGLLKNYAPPVFKDYESSVIPLLNPKDIKLALDHLDTDCDLVAFDYETSSLNPYKGQPKVWYASVSDGSSAVSFPMTEEIIPSWRKFLENPNIRKIAHNLKFEDKWSRVVFGCQPKNWYWDTMVTQHVLDGRKKTTGLKFQAYVRYGAKGYDKEIDKYKTNWAKCPVDLALKYCGMDSLFTFMLYEDQFVELQNTELVRGNKLFFDGNLALADIEHTGIPTDQAHYQTESDKLQLEIESGLDWLANTDEALQFKSALRRDLDVASTKDLGILFYDLLKLKSVKKTAKDKNAVDEFALLAINTPFTKKLLEVRKLEKIKNTYLAQFIRETGDDLKLHPSFNLNMVVTYRSSSDKPNFQNVPVREENAKRITRSGIMPSNGNQLLEVDYASLEVRIIACVTKDPVLVDYLKAGSDPHKDEAMNLFNLTKDQWAKLDKQQAKDIRFYTKNQKVFPYFYGSWHKAVAENVWPLIDQLQIKDHLKSVGIKTYPDFLAHCERDEIKFWKKFAVVKQWHNSLERDYMEKGCVEYVTGFQSEGYLSRNDLFNYPIQGPAFHCLLWSLIELNKELQGRKTKIIGQIHDSIVFDLYPPEKDLVLNLCTGIMTRRIKRKWPWLIVPLLVEFEITDIDKPWYTKGGI